MTPTVARVQGSDEQVLVLDIAVVPGAKPLAIIVHEGGQMDYCGLGLLTVEYANGGDWPVGFRFHSLAAEKVPA